MPAAHCGSHSTRGCRSSSIPTSVRPPTRVRAQEGERRRQRRRPASSARRLPLVQVPRVAAPVHDWLAHLLAAAIRCGRKHGATRAAGGEDVSNGALHAARLHAPAQQVESASHPQIPPTCSPASSPSPRTMAPTRLSIWRRRGCCASCRCCAACCACTAPACCSPVPTARRCAISESAGCSAPGMKSPSTEGPRPDSMVACVCCCCGSCCCCCGGGGGWDAPASGAADGGAPAGAGAASPLPTGAWLATAVAPASMPSDGGNASKAECRRRREACLPLAAGGR